MRGRRGWRCVEDGRGKGELRLVRKRKDERRMEERAERVEKVE